MNHLNPENSKDAFLVGISSEACELLIGVYEEYRDAKYIFDREKGFMADSAPAYPGLYIAKVNFYPKQEDNLDCEKENCVCARPIC